MSLKSFVPLIGIISILPCAPLSATCEPDTSENRSPSIVSNFVIPTLYSIVPEVVATVFTKWAKDDGQFGLDMYRGYRCFELGVAGLRRVYDYHYGQKRTNTAIAVAEEKDLSLNQAMFGYLLADTIVQAFMGNFRTDLLIHHLMGLTLWGATLTYGIFPDVIAMNAAVEILSALKGFETYFKRNGADISLSDQRFLKSAYAFRLAVILLIRYPIWLVLDWNLPNEHYAELGPVGWGVLRSLNVGILGLETLWLYQTGKAFNRYRFW